MASSNCTTQVSEGKDEVSALKKKSEQAKKSELLREIQKLNVQIQAMEREKLTHIFSKRSDFQKDFGALQEEEMKMTEERKTEKIKIKQQLEKMSHMVKRFHKELRDVKPTPEFVEKLKTIMENIEETINSYKEQQRSKYEELMRSERTVWQELQQLERKFESWSQAPQADLATARTASSRPLGSARDVTKDLPPEVAAFDKFVHQSGGHRGGWDEHDHQTFLKYRNMYKGRIVFLDHLKPMLPTRTETETREHEAWYQEYAFLNENKKYAIKKWRERKEEEKDDAISQVQTELNTEQEEKKKKPQGISAQEKAERSKNINAWKVQKELEKAIEKEKKMKEELEKKKHQEEERKKQLEAKRKVEFFKLQKQHEEEMLELMEEERKREEIERRREVISREIGRFRNRDMQRLNEKMEKEKEKLEKKKEKERKLEALKSQVQVEVPRDPNRLLKPTAGWKQRLKEQGPSGESGPILNMPHRAVPSWRQGML